MSKQSQSTCQCWCHKKFQLVEYVNYNFYAFCLSAVIIVYIFCGSPRFAFLQCVPGSYRDWNPAITFKHPVLHEPWGNYVQNKSSELEDYKIYYKDRNKFIINCLKVR